MELKFDQERKIFALGKKPVYLCHGEYEFLHKEMAWKIVRFLLPEDEMDVGFQKFDGSDADALDVIADAASVPSMFADTQVLLVYNAQAMTLIKTEETAPTKKKTAPSAKYKNHRAFEKLIDVIRGKIKNSHIIFVADESLKKPTSKTGVSRSEKALQRCYTEIVENGVVVEFTKMYDDSLLEWVRGRAAMQGIRWNQDLAEMFLEWAGKDVRHIVGELDKLASFFTDGREVTEKEMRRLITSNEDFYINSMIEFMLARRPKAALRMLDSSMERGAHPVLIIASVCARMRQLWQARFLVDKGYFTHIPAEYGFAAKQDITYNASRVKPEHAAALAANPAESILKKTPFALYHIFKYARNFALDEIEAAIVRAWDTDRRLKAIERPKHGSDEIMLETLIVDIASGGQKTATKVASNQ